VRFAILVLLLLRTLASAEGDDGFHDRRISWGLGIGLGGMSDDGGRISCINCDYNTAALELDAHLGRFVSPRLALLLEVEANGQTVAQNANNTTSTVVQTTLMLAGQYWLTTQLWIKGGVGFAHLEQEDSYFEGTDVTPVDSGLAVLGAIGFEVLSSRRFALDFQGRLIEGTYDGIHDHLTSGTIGVGFSWY
jgi:hypothetical protein